LNSTGVQRREEEGIGKETLKSNKEREKEIRGL